jgi:hypothetical protein
MIYHICIQRSRSDSSGLSSIPGLSNNDLLHHLVFGTVSVNKDGDIFETLVAGKVAYVRSYTLLFLQIATYAIEQYLDYVGEVQCGELSGTNLCGFVSWLGYREPYNTL